MHRIMDFLARGMALLGGLVLSFLILLTCLSVLGRLLNTILHNQVMPFAPDLAKWFLDLGVGPILGDFELVEAGVAFAIFAFLPLCQISAAHASVDILTSQFPLTLNRFLRMIVEIIFAAALVLIAWKLFDGMLSKRDYGETTFLLEFPIWWAYAASLFGAVSAALAGVYMAWIRTCEFFTRRVIVARGTEAEHDNP